MSIPRILTGTPAEMGRLNALAARRYTRSAGVRGVANVYGILARHRRLFRPYMAFASRLAPGGTIPRADTELLILRASANAGSEYEWHHHSRIARDAGLSVDEIERVKLGWRADGWSHWQSTLLRAADELAQSHCLSDESWAALRTRYTEPHIIEICLLVGNYHLLAMVLNTARVQLEGV